MFKLALSAGHYLYTAGKRCLKSIDSNETREWWLNDRIADRIQVLLAEYEGVEVLRLDDTTGQKDVSLKTRADAANNWKANFYLAIHHNAGISGGSGGGIAAYAWNGSLPQSTLNWQKDLYNELIKLTGLKGNRSNGCPRSDLYECRVPTMDAVLLELGFMDSTIDTPIILTQDFAYKCAQACVNVIVKKANLKKKTTTTTTVGSTYKLVTEVNRYASAADAQAKINSRGKYAAGTYYIFNKYPNGLNGMYNISSDKTGASAGSWINPSENKIEEVKEEVQKLYRVRKSKDDAKTQKGAYSSLDSAKVACQKAGSDYHVFDWNFNIVYSYTAPVKPEEPKVEPTPAPTPTPVVKNVYDLDFPIKTKIVDSDVVQTEGINEEDCTQAIVAITKNNTDFDANIAKAFFLLADEYHINPMMAISQSVLETGWFKYSGSAVKPEHHNYCGLGVTSNGIEGGKFDTIENGVRAQLQHLYAYGCKDALPDGETTIVDPRFKYVTRGIATYWQQLAGRWAVPGYDKNTYSTPEAAMAAENTYGQKILNICKQLENTKVSEKDIKRYFPENQPDDPTVDPKDDIDTDKVNSVLALLEKILNIILGWFTKNN